MIWLLAMVVGVVKKAMEHNSKMKVAIFSADRKSTQNKTPGVLQSGTKIFGSKSQAGKVNTFTVGSTIGPQNPSGQ